MPHKNHDELQASRKIPGKSFETPLAQAFHLDEQIKDQDRNSRYTSSRRHGYSKCRGTTFTICCLKMKGE
jgi:hypothetical protein